MRILTRYVVAELAKVFLLCLTGVTMMMLVVGVFQELAKQQVPLGEVVLRLIPYILPEALRFAVPVTLLLTTTSVYGRMSGSNEVVAIKALGLSPMVILWPTYVLAFLLSLVAVWLNDLAVSWGRNGARRVVIEAVEEIAYAMLRSQHSYNSQSFSINVRSVEDRRLIRPTLTIQPRDNSPEMTITADEAELHADHAQDVLRIVLQNATFDLGGKVKSQFPGTSEQEIPLDVASRAQSTPNTPSWLALWQIPQQEARQRAVLRQIEQELAARAAYQMLCGDFADLTGAEWEGHAQTLTTMRVNLHRLATEPHRRWSAGFSCLCFAWVGAPMAIRLRNRDFLTSFFLCFLHILIVYYPLLAVSADGAKAGTLPPYAVWLGNALLAFWGAMLLRKVMRY
jgi:lipopolysaccharide export system permease protein